MLFVGVARKIVVPLNWCTNPVSYANALEFQRCSQKPGFRFCAFCFEDLLLVYRVCPL